MNTGVEVALLVPVAYLLGTFPSATLVARRRGVDVTAESSGNPGASNTFRLLGWKSGALVFAMDVLKGVLAALAGLAVDGHRGAYVLGVAAVLGHVWPVTRRFKGGRGVATGAGVMLVIFPALTLAMVVLWVVLARVTHKASVASVTVAIVFPIAVALAGHEAGDIIVISVMALLVVARHLSNLRRLVKGEELGLESSNASSTELDEPDERDEPPDVGDERAAS
ncbi:MAG TPA: glycerol-3-phosphate acyltransferase [Acidimicrobiia bacterium]|nr:glycerol-3-phosphate acyltransferase [Acidimicrobiia bacterium]